MHGPFLLPVIRGWCDLPRSRRYAFCLLLLAANTALFLDGKLWFAGWVPRPCGWARIEKSRACLMLRA